jgi:hypothetical protein
VPLPRRTWTLRHFAPVRLPVDTGRARHRVHPRANTTVHVGGRVSSSAVRASANVGVRSPTPHPSSTSAPRLLGSGRNFREICMPRLPAHPTTATTATTANHYPNQLSSFAPSVLGSHEVPADEDYPPPSYMDYAKRIRRDAGHRVVMPQKLQWIVLTDIPGEPFAGVAPTAYHGQCISSKRARQADDDRHSARHAHRYHSTTRAPPCPEHAQRRRRCFQKRRDPLWKRAPYLVRGCSASCTSTASCILTAGLDMKRQQHDIISILCIP